MELSSTFCESSEKKKEKMQVSKSFGMYCHPHDDESSFLAWIGWFAAIPLAPSLPCLFLLGVDILMSSGCIPSRIMLAGLEGKQTACHGILKNFAWSTHVNFGTSHIFVVAETSHPRSFLAESCDDVIDSFLRNQTRTRHEENSTCCSAMNHTATKYHTKYACKQS